MNRIIVLQILAGYFIYAVNWYLLSILGKCRYTYENKCSIVIISRLQDKQYGLGFRGNKNC